MELKLELSNFENFLRDDLLIGNQCREEYLKSKINERNVILSDFPYSIVLKTSYSQIDFAEWLLWQLFGDMNGICNQNSSDIPACKIKNKHQHKGNWTNLWLAKTDYDYGFNEWFFKSKKDCKIFINILPLLKQMKGWGIYTDKYFWNFLENQSIKASVLPINEKLKHFKSINWEKITDEILNETYNF